MPARVNLPLRHLVALTALVALSNGCSLLPVLEQTKVVNARVESLESQIDILAGHTQNLHTLTDAQKVEFVNSLVEAKEQTKALHEDLTTMGTTGAVAGGIVLLRFIGPLVGGPLGGLLSGIGAMTQAAARRREDK